MTLTRLFVDESAVKIDLDGLTAVALHRSHELDLAVAVPVVVPVHKWRHPLTGGLLAREWPDGVVSRYFAVRNRDSE
jgi:hypothetical protein